MALRSNPPTTEQRDHTNLIAGTEGVGLLQDNNRIITRQGAVAAEADFDLAVST